MSEEILEEKSEKKFSRMAIGFLVVLVLGVLGSGVFAAYYYGLHKNTAPSNKADEEVAMLVAQVGKLIDLPEGEIPTVATVADKTKLESQNFFKKSENGDKVLIYTESGRAFLYRPSTKKIVDVTVINVNEKTAEPIAPTAPSIPGASEDPQIVPEGEEQSEGEELLASESSLAPSVALYNGTTKKGLTQRQEDVILAGFKDVTVLEKETANSTDYKKTLVVDASGKYPELVASLAKKYRAETVGLPEGERETAADVLIIFGEDQL